VATILSELGPNITDLQRRTTAERARLGRVKLQLQRDWTATKKLDAQAAAQRQTVLRAQIHANSVARTDYTAMAQQVADALNDAKITQDQSVQLTRLHDAATAIFANPESTSAERVQATTILDAIAGRRPFGLPMERVAQTAKELGLPSLGQLETAFLIVAAIIIVPPVVRLMSPRQA
jgi:hypothetical protein